MLYKVLNLSSSPARLCAAGGERGIQPLKRTDFSMKVDATVRRETLYIARWVLALSALTQLVFLVAGWWDYTVLLGNLLSGCAAVGNFFLMGRSVQKAVTQDQADAAKTMHASQQLRSLGLFVVAAVGVALPCFHLVTVLLPLFFPRIAVAFRPIFKGKEDLNETQQPGK